MVAARVDRLPRGRRGPGCLHHGAAPSMTRSFTSGVDGENRWAPVIGLEGADVRDELNAGMTGRVRPNPAQEYRSAIAESNHEERWTPADRMNRPRSSRWRFPFLASSFPQ
jgi:hypothetical protein